MPLTPLTGDVGQADLAVLEQWADPRALLRLGKAQLTAVIAKASRNHLGAARAEVWLAAAEAAVQLYCDHPAVAFVDLAAEVATEVRLIRAIEAELAVHAAERETAYRWADPGQLARTLPGLAEVGGPTLAAIMGEATRFPTSAHFKSYLGLAPRASETGDTDRKGQPMSKAGSRLLRSTLVRAADHARKQDPQMARIYYVQIVELGAGHLKALCVVAARLAERGWAVMHRRMPYVICDTTGEPVTPEQAKKIIAEKWAVPAEVRTRRRSRKTVKGKAPQQVHTGHDKPHARGAGERGDLPHPRSSSRTTNTSSTPLQRAASGHPRDEGTGR
jgi:hypothetical protein